MLNGLRKQHPYFHDNCTNLVCFEKEPDVIKMSRRPFNVFLMVSGKDSIPKRTHKYLF